MDRSNIRKLVSIFKWVLPIILFVSICLSTYGQKECKFKVTSCDLVSDTFRLTGRLSRESFISGSRIFLCRAEEPECAEMFDAVIFFSFGTMNRFLYPPFNHISVTDLKELSKIEMKVDSLNEDFVYLSGCKLNSLKKSFFGRMLNRMFFGKPHLNIYFFDRSNISASKFYTFWNVRY